MNEDNQRAVPGASSSRGRARRPPESTGHLQNDELGAFAIGRLEPSEAERIESHLEHCEECGSRLDRLIRSDSLVGRLRGDEDAGGSETASGGSTTSPLPAAPTIGPASHTHEIGRAFRNHRLISILGSGGMGVVYRASDSLIGRDVALKVLHEAVARDPMARGRFLAEARAQGRLNHRNIVTIYSIDELESTMYIVMELAPGGSMADRLRRSGALPWQEATRAMTQACRGLAAAHAAGLIHRDVKPENLLIDAEGNVKLGDFGLAKAPEAVSMTHSNQLVGTPHFMSPEQCRCEPIDPRSDIYQMGATYFKLLTGSNPYPHATTLFQAIHAHCNLPIPDPRAVDADIPDDCAAIVMEAMAKEAADRYQTAEEFFADLMAVHDSRSGVSSGAQPVVAHEPKSGEAPAGGGGSRPRLALAMLLVVAALAIAGFLNRPAGDVHNVRSGAGAGASSAGDEPIRVGILHSLSGTMADSEAPVVDVILLGIGELNDAGGLLGRRVEPVVADGRSDPAVFARQAERLIVEEGVRVVFGCWTSASRKTVVPIFEQHDHLLIYPVQYEGLERSRNVIYTGAVPNQQLLPAVRWAFAFEDKRRFFLVGSDYVFPRTAHEIIRDELAELGAELVGEEYLPLGSSDVAAVVAKIVAAAPDVILNTINGDSNIAFFEALRASGVSPKEVPTISFSIGEVELTQLDLEQMVGDYACWTYFQSVDDPINARFVERFRAKYGPQRVVTDPMEAAYFSVKLWAQAVVAAKSADVARTRPAMCDLQFRAPQGIVRIDPRTQHTIKTPRIGRVRADGQFDVIWQAAPVPPVPFPPSRSRADWERFLANLYRKWDGRWSPAAWKAR